MVYGLRFRAYDLWFSVYREFMIQSLMFMVYDLWFMV